MKKGTEFVVAYKGFKINTFLEFYRKIHNYQYCVMLIEERDGLEITRYVRPKAFCNQYELVEELFVDE